MMKKMTAAAQMPPLERKEADQARQERVFAFEVRATGDNGEIEGYGSVWGVKDSYDDVIASGAFGASLKAHKAAGTMPAMLWQHNPSEPIGVWTEMSEDKSGLKVKGKLALETVRGKEAHALMKMGALNGLSIGFVSKEWNYDRETEVRTLTEIDLWEVSLVTFPANQKARVTSVKATDVQGITTIRQAEKALRDAGFSDDAAKAFIASVKGMAMQEREARDAAIATHKAAIRLLETLKT